MPQYSPRTFAYECYFVKSSVEKSCPRTPVCALIFIQILVNKRTNPSAFTKAQEWLKYCFGAGSLYFYLHFFSFCRRRKHTAKNISGNATAPTTTQKHRNYKTQIRVSCVNENIVNKKKVFQFTILAKLFTIYRACATHTRIWPMFGVH